MNELQKLIEKYPDKPWNWRGISLNPNITWKFIETNQDKPWNWSYLSSNPNITMEIIEANPNKLWDWACISMNPNITWEIIEANPDKPWNWLYISRNKFNYDKKKKLKQKIKRKLFIFGLCVSALNYNEIKYRPGNSGYLESFDNFKTLIV